MSKDRIALIQFVALFILRYVVVYGVLYTSFADTISALKLFICTIWLVGFVHMIYELEETLQLKSFERKVKDAFIGISKEELKKMLEHDE